MALKNTFLCIILFLLAGCPLQVEIVLYNFTGDDVRIISNSGVIPVPNMAHVEVDEDKFHFDRDLQGFEVIKLSNGRCYIVSFGAAVSGQKELFNDSRYSANIVFTRQAAYFVPPSIKISNRLDFAKFHKLDSCR
ncbi:hypothetical protein QSH18_00690 [Xanthomonas sp. NCPPB 2654]|uniref:hypothetical protein n=1 Tax=unclassified Xanthomonas TaxID=2643310 RepID=UPI0021DF8995|nr:MULTISPECIES: hypothetical protein [unclassified Xanthomonas]MDL5364118.1 hypothetical protein [Xanthomonas sp. NCPPB 2654]UYC20887.1 hypothetical protein NUG20_00830 [Xanthomonas sp. CFBP 8443]